MTFVQTQAQTGASPTTVDRWFTIFRQICMDSLNVGREDGKIGGVGTVVECDETKIGKRKYHR